MKSITKHLNLERISQKLSDVFTETESLARATLFVKRRSPLTGLMFVQALVIGFLKDPQASLSQLAQECARLGFSISPQGLHERIQQGSVDFLKVLVQQAVQQLKSQIALPITLLHQFTQILVVDSTYQTLPDSLEEPYPGSGGKAPRACLKVQLVYDFISGNLSQLAIQAGRAADQGYTQYLETVTAGSLVLLDLGYFRLASLDEIAQKGAFFLMRYRYGTVVYSLEGSRVDLLAYLESQGPAAVERLVLLGTTSKTPVTCRLITVPVPREVAEERRRKVKRNAQEHGKTASERQLRMLGWSIYLTNVPEEKLSTTQVIAFYRIRWQIELIFKFWKSYGGLDKLPGVRPERVMTEFYAKLLAAIVSNFLVAPIRLPHEEFPEHEIGLFQVRKILGDFAQDLLEKCFDLRVLQAHLEAFYHRIARYAFKQIRRKKPNALARLAQLSTTRSPLA
jgi:hypothetical protein